MGGNTRGGSGSHYDAIVVGSGFGGGVSAYRFAREGMSVCVLERGKAYGPGDFPRSPHDMSRNFWDPSEGLQGMFDIWAFSGIRAVVCSGLGGGSLIYANVLLRKDPNWFVHQPMPGGEVEEWPVTYGDLVPHYDAVEQMMNVQKYPLDQPPYDQTSKTHAFREGAEAAGLEWRLPNLAVTFANDGRPPVPGERIEEPGNIHGKPRVTCRLVGECDAGCNYGSKNSIDYTYLSRAADEGAEILTRREVRSFERRPDGGFVVRYVEHTDAYEGRKVDTSLFPEREMTCDRLVLAAGTLGTTYLLLKNLSAFKDLSPMLGRRFSGNGDFLGLVFRARRPDGAPWILNPSFGPVITSYGRRGDEVDGDGSTGRGFYVEDAGYPQFVNWLVESGLPGQASRAARFLIERGWARLTKRPGTRMGSPLSKLLGRNLLTATSVPLLGMGRDVPDGNMRLHDGLLDVDWSSKASRAYFGRVNDTMRAVARYLGGWYVSFWWLNFLVTVHPLGGCPMGADPTKGVVDPYGQVYGYPGLSIADGSVMPGPVGANPALTIAALADRSADRTIEQWKETRRARA
ncbi:MAG TPA: GMC family oxidoreductase [Actinomycetota bacterium]|nr:GMC family oxidoreductase [Actinomycetota bacterium]